MISLHAYIALHAPHGTPLERAEARRAWRRARPQGMKAQRKTSHTRRRWYLTPYDVEKMFRGLIRKPAMQTVAEKITSGLSRMAAPVRNAIRKMMRRSQAR